MGLLQEGKWVDRWYQTEDTGGRFVRKSASFRNWITADGSPGFSGSGGFKAEKGRYHLYVSLACPWAHRSKMEIKKSFVLDGNLFKMLSGKNYYAPKT